MEKPLEGFAEALAQASDKSEFVGLESQMACRIGIRVFFRTEEWIVVMEKGLTATVRV